MSSFPPIERIHEILDQIAEKLPNEFFDKLNEGIILLPQAKLHTMSKNDKKLYILGEYSKSITGAHITIYYGSFANIYSRADEKTIENKLEETLLHEFTHHLETLAGERGLIIKDQKELKEYLGE